MELSAASTYSDNLSAIDILSQNGYSTASSVQT